MKYFRFLLITFLSLSLANPVLEARPTKDEFIEVEPLPHLSKQLKAKTVSKRIQDTQKREALTLSKAKGVVGEEVAREHMEKVSEGRIVSLFTHFEAMGCDIKSSVRGNGDQGLDDIFVFLNKKGQIDRKSPPIFHEAKYNSKCQFRLNTTETIGEQLSRPWIRHNLNHTTTVKFCFPDDSQKQVRSCSKCDKRFERDIQWIQTQFDNKTFLRTASLLCANGKLKFYKEGLQF